MKLQAILRAKAIVYEDKKAPRYLRRQAGRGLGMDMSTAVRVVKWRKTVRRASKDGNHAGATVGFHHVRGHFREQWYPSKERHEAIFIESHFRGTGPLKRDLPVVNYIRD